MRKVIYRKFFLMKPLPLEAPVLKCYIVYRNNKYKLYINPNRYDTYDPVVYTYNQKSKKNDIYLMQGTYENGLTNIKIGKENFSYSSQDILYIPNIVTNVAKYNEFYNEKYYDSSYTYEKININGINGISFFKNTMYYLYEKCFELTCISNNFDTKVYNMETSFPMSLVKAFTLAIFFNNVNKNI